MSSLQTSGPALTNLLRYQAIWFATVLGAAHNRPDLGAEVGVLMVVWHVWWARSPVIELSTIGITLLVGALWEGIMVHFGLVNYQAGSTLFGVPLWILVLWMGFGTTLNGCLGWLRRQLGIAAILGGLLGPLSWLGGAQLGALKIPDPATGYTALGVGWFFVMPFLSLIARECTERAGHLNGDHDR